MLLFSVGDGEILFLLWKWKHSSIWKFGHISGNAKSHLGFESQSRLFKCVANRGDFGGKAFHLQGPDLLNSMSRGLGAWVFKHEQLGPEEHTAGQSRCLVLSGWIMSPSETSVWFEHSGGKSSEETEIQTPPSVPGEEVAGTPNHEVGGKADKKNRG